MGFNARRAGASPSLRHRFCFMRRRLFESEVELERSFHSQLVGWEAYGRSLWKGLRSSSFLVRTIQRNGQRCVASWSYRCFLSRFLRNDVGWTIFWKTSEENWSSRVDFRSLVCWIRRLAHLHWSFICCFLLGIFLFSIRLQAEVRQNFNSID